MANQYTKADTRTLDAVLAERLFGWTTRDHPLFPWIQPVTGIAFSAPPAISTSWEGMGLVLEAMKARGWDYEVRSIPAASVATRAHCEFHRAFGEFSDRSADSLPMAVALAALTALGESK